MGEHFFKKRQNFWNYVKRNLGCSTQLLRIEKKRVFKEIFKMEKGYITIIPCSITVAALG